MERFAVTPCNDMSWGGSEKKRWLSTRRFDQYALIVFWRKPYSLCCTVPVSPPTIDRPTISSLNYNY